MEIFSGENAEGRGQIVRRDICFESIFDICHNLIHCQPFNGTGHSDQEVVMTRAFFSSVENFNF